uniref:Chloride channel protein n=1 Tax=Syphacia muris TaxID=451379 RepID=A0A0N5AGE0_9BILA
MEIFRPEEETRQSLLGETDENHDDSEPTSGDLEYEVARVKKESFKAFCRRTFFTQSENSFSGHLQNVIHFFVEDWFLSAMLGIITAVLSIGVDVAIEYIQHYRVVLYEYAQKHHEFSALVSWVSYITLMTGAAALFCNIVSKQAVGSGIPEVKVIMHGFVMKGYLTLRTMIAKMVGLTLALGSGLPVGKEGPFVHMGAAVASLLTRATASFRYQAFFSNEGREMELLSSGCAVGIACTFSAPAGAVLYGIESTSKYFAVKNYWRAFFATTCSALIFRAANAAIIPPHIELRSGHLKVSVCFFVAGTITAYYQTNFPNEVFVVEEIPVFALMGILSGLLGALFVLIHRNIAYFRQKNRLYKVIFGRNPVFFTIFMAAVVGMLTYPEGTGRYFAGKLTFRETLADFIANCTFSLTNTTERGCPPSRMEHWTGGPGGKLDVIFTLTTYLVVYFILVAICVSLAVPAGIFVPSFVIGACGGRIIGELMAAWFPEGMRGIGGPQIYPGLYAVVGAAAYTGSVTHSLSIAVIVCETTGQLCPLLPVLTALMIGVAISSFLQPSVYESIIKIKNYPHLADLPPSRVSVHTLKVEKVMVHDVICITKDTTYKELRALLIATPNFRSYPLVTDMKTKILLGSVARKYLNYLLMERLGPDPALLERKRRNTASEIFSPFKRTSHMNLNTFLTDRNISGNTLLAHSPLHDSLRENGPLAPLLRRQAEPDIHVLFCYYWFIAFFLFWIRTLKCTSCFLQNHTSLLDRAALLQRKIDLDEIAIDPAPFQLVLGTSLYKVHTLFSLLGLHHAYVTNRGKLVGVISTKELRDALANIYSRGAVPTYSVRKSTMSLNHPSDSVNRVNDKNDDEDDASDEDQSSSSADVPSRRSLSKVESDGTVRINMTNPNDTSDKDSDRLLK